MAWTNRTAIQLLMLASVATSTTSCGSTQLMAQSTVPQNAPQETQSETGDGLLVRGLLSLPSLMPTVDAVLSSEILAALDVPNEAVSIEFRLGPKMKTRSFEINRDGEMDEDALKELRGMFRCRRSHRTHRINRDLLAKIADLASHYDGHTIEIISAYRHGRHASRGSRHRAGRAIDIRVVGVPAVKVRDYLWARYDQEVGVGFYQKQQFIHLDHRTDYPATAWTQRGGRGANQYKPGWSRPSRRSKLVAALTN